MKRMETRFGRREFLKKAAAVGVGAATWPSIGVLGANDRFRIAVCGLHGRGKSHAKAYAGMDNVELVYVVDPDKHVAENAARRFSNKNHQVKPVADVREVLDDKNIDALSVATPNHWHSLMAIWAAQAGKHCYVEKPASHDIYEGRVAAEAYKKYGVIIQHGTQQRSNQSRANQIKAIREGKYGRLKISYGYCCKPRKGIGNKEFTAPPDHLDWNLWRGPADIERYHGNYVHYDWHWFWETGNGDLNNQGTHELDVARWALDEDQSIINGNMEEAHYSCVTGHVMNNSYRLGKKVPFNAKAGKFGDNEDAHEHFMKLHEIMKDGVGVPVDKAEYVVGPWLTFDPTTERFTGEHAAEANKLLRDPDRKGFEIPDAGKA